MTPSQLKNAIETARPDSKFFCRENMRGSGDTMANYGVCSSTIETITGEMVECWELFRRRPTSKGLSASAYFCKETLQQRFPK